MTTQKQKKGDNFNTFAKYDPMPKKFKTPRAYKTLKINLFLFVNLICTNKTNFTTYKYVSNVQN